MNYLVSPRQLKILIEGVQGTLFDVNDVETSIVRKMCQNSKRKGIKGGPWCELKDLYVNNLTDDLRKQLDSDVSKLIKIYKKKHYIGILPMIISLSLKDKNKTVNDINLITDFITTSQVASSTIKKRLLSLKNAETLPPSEELEKLLKYAKHLEHKKYEESFEGDEFEVKRTSLSLDFKCSDKIKDKLIVLIQKLDTLLTSQSEERKEKIINAFVKRFTTCVKESMDSTVNPIKSDLYLKKDLYVVKDNQNIVVLPKGNYEVKRIDPLIDSYLSEFFSIFKESDISHLKQKYIDLYNIIIEKIFQWIRVNGGSYLENIKQNMNGVVYSDQYIVPIKYIDLYWSNKGQRGCGEKRISIRYKLNPDTENKNIEVYKYTKGSDVVELVTDFKNKIKDLSFEEQICK